MRRQSKKTIPSLKRKAWTVFSSYIRLRDCLKTTGTKTQGNCYTCDRLVEYKQSQSGHFIPGRTASVLFEPNQVHLQCYSCNVCNHGNWPAYYERMVDEYGLEEVEKMLQKRHETHKWKREELEDIYQTYLGFLNNLNA